MICEVSSECSSIVVKAPSGESECVEDCQCILLKYPRFAFCDFYSSIVLLYRIFFLASRWLRIFSTLQVINLKVKVICFSGFYIYNLSSIFAYVHRVQKKTCSLNNFNKFIRRPIYNNLYVFITIITIFGTKVRFTKNM